MPKMKPFTEADWSAWAGCDGSDPKIGEVKFITADNTEMDATIIADTSGLMVYPFYEDELDIQWYLWDSNATNPKDYQRSVNAMAELLPDTITEQQLLDLGFRKV